MGPKLRGLLAEFWSRQEGVTHQNGFHDPWFQVIRGATQGGLSLLTIFNVLLNRVVCHWISLTVEDEQGTHEELGMVAGRCMGVFNADDGMLGSRYPEWLQGAINVLIRLFRRVRLMVNVAKSKNMTCQPGAIHMGISE